MEIWHRLTFSHRSGVEAELSRLGVPYKRTDGIGDAYLLHVEIEESSPLWEQLSLMSREKSALDVFNTRFTEDEILSSQWVRFCPSYEYGYPEPRKRLAWKQTTLKGVCEECGAGFVQVQPFLIKSDNASRKFDFLTLVGTNTLFASQVVASVLERESITGLSFSRPNVVDGHGPSTRITQLMVSEVEAPSLIAGPTPSICERCGISKHVPHLKGFMELSADSFRPDSEIVRSGDWFGSGHDAFQEFLASKRVAEIILREKWTGITLKPVRLV
jgi:hypothetical protein